MSEIDFIQTQPSEIIGTILQNLEDRAEEELYPGDERRIFADALSYVIIILFSAVNDACRQRLLRYARGNVLDAIGEMFGTERQEGRKTTTTIRFGINEAMDRDIIIPAGTRVTADYTVYFQTTQEAVLMSGSMHTDVPAAAEKAGESYNGIESGKINVLVDQIPYIDYVANTAETDGGTDEEDDDAYRNRIRIAPSSWSTAGPEQAYRYWALSADVSISDVYIHSPQKGEVEIIVLGAGGTIPGKDVIDAVKKACSDDSRRPLTDHVTVSTPEQVEYDIDITYYTTPQEAEACKEAVEGEQGAVKQYQEWQDAKIGRHINPDYLRRLVLSPNNEMQGAVRIDVTSPQYTELEKTQVAKVKEIKINRIVRDDDSWE